MTKKPLAEGLDQFIKNHGIEKDEYGRLLFYKAVRSDRSSWYIESERSCDYQTVRRSERCKGVYKNGAEISCHSVSNYRGSTCDRGLHVGSLLFARDFAERIMSSSCCHILQVAVWPEDVVCVPYSQVEVKRNSWHKEPTGKIRVKKLQVIKRIK